MTRLSRLLALVLSPVWASEIRAMDDRPAGPLRLSWADEMLTISGRSIPGGSIEVWYIEAFCRAGSTDRDWNETVIPHRTVLKSASDDGRTLVLESTLDDGVKVTHTIQAGNEQVRFTLEAHNPTDRASGVHWGQPCIRVDRFAGVEKKQNGEDYLPQCFVFVDGSMKFLPTQPWATRARYTPGQVWCPRHVSRDDVNPRPLSSIVPSNGLIGCVSSDRSMLLATAWEPYQELFQGVIVCVHSDFRIGGLAPGETKKARGSIYVLPNKPEALIEQYGRDFPEHARP